MPAAPSMWQRYPFAALSAICTVPAVSTVSAVPAVSAKQLLLRAGALRMQEGRAAGTAPARADTAPRAAATELIVVEQLVSADQIQVAFEQQ